MAEVYLICDASGSMVEDGRRFVVRNIVRTVDQYYRLHAEPPDLYLVYWSSETEIAKWNPGQDFPEQLLACAGSASGDSLIEALAEAPDGYFMLITDGYWTHETRRQVSSWSRSLPDGHLRVLKVGVDANPKIKGPSVFSGEDVLVALENWVR